MTLVFTAYSLTGSGGYPINACEGADGNIWCVASTSHDGPYIYKVSPSGSLLNRYTLPTVSGSQVVATNLILNSDGNIWADGYYYTTTGSGRFATNHYHIGFTKITTAGVMTFYDATATQPIAPGQSGGIATAGATYDGMLMSALSGYGGTKCWYAYYNPVSAATGVIEILGSAGTWTPDYLLSVSFDGSGNFQIVDQGDIVGTDSDYNYGAVYTVDPSSPSSYTQTTISPGSVGGVDSILGTGAVSPVDGHFWMTADNSNPGMYDFTSSTFYAGSVIAGVNGPSMQPGLGGGAFGGDASGNIWAGGEESLVMFDTATQTVTDLSSLLPSDFGVISIAAGPGPAMWGAGASGGGSLELFTIAPATATSGWNVGPLAMTPQISN